MHRDDARTSQRRTPPSAAARPAGPLRIGIGGPVGGGKTALVAALCRALRDELSLVVVTNDIYTTEDADFLRRHGVLPDERIRRCAPAAARTPRSGTTSPPTSTPSRTSSRGHDPTWCWSRAAGDNLTATFSYGLVDAQIFVLDVAGGDKVPRKGGPGVTRSDLLVINKTDLAPLVGADLDVMRTDAEKVREGRPTVLTSLREQPDAAPDRGVAGWCGRRRGCAGRRRAAGWDGRAVVTAGRAGLSRRGVTASASVVADRRRAVVRGIRWTPGVADRGAADGERSACTSCTGRAARSGGDVLVPRRPGRRRARRSRCAARAPRSSSRVEGRSRPMGLRRGRRWRG